MTLGITCGIHANLHSITVMSGSDPRITRNADMQQTSEVEPDG